MAGIKGVSSAQAWLYVKIAYHFIRRGIAALTGRETERMLEPLEMYAHVPVLFKGYAKLEQATARLHRLDKRLHALAELKAATLTHCEYARLPLGDSPLGLLGAGVGGVVAQLVLAEAGLPVRAAAFVNPLARLCGMVDGTGVLR